MNIIQADELANFTFITFASSHLKCLPILDPLQLQKRDSRQLGLMTAKQFPGKLQSKCRG